MLVDLLALPATGPLIGLDPGTRTLGLAASDQHRLIATPLPSLSRGRRFAPTCAALLDLFDQRQAVGLVVGLPLNMDGSEGPRAQATRALVRNILSSRDIPIALHDERLSTAQAERDMIAADMSRAKRAEAIDSAAAAIILQSALDRLENAKPDGNP